MKKLMMLAAMLALMAVVVVPALASDGFDDGDLIVFDDCFPFCDGDGFGFGDDDNGDNGDDGSNGGGGDVAVQEFGQEAESGDAEVSFEVINTGDNSNQCVPANQFVNTGNLQNAQGFVQYGSSADDIEFSGSSFVFEPSMEVVCDQSVQQSASAGW